LIVTGVQTCALPIWVRDRRADGVDVAGRDHLSDGRRRWHDRHVEGFRRNAGTRMDRRETSADDLRASCWMRADSKGLPGRCEERSEERRVGKEGRGG